MCTFLDRVENTLNASLPYPLNTSALKGMHVHLSWSKADQEESKKCDPMNRYQGAECQECRWMKGGPYYERVTVNSLYVSPVRSSRPGYKRRENIC